MALRLFSRAGRHSGLPLRLCVLQRAHASTRGIGHEGHHQTTQEDPSHTKGPHSTASVRRGNIEISREVKNTISGIETARLYLAGLGPLSPQDLVVEKRLSVPGCNPTEILRQSIRTGDASVHVVRLCLETQYQEIKQMSRKARRDMAKAQDDIASVALDFITQDQNLWGLFAMYCFAAQFWLSYYAIVQGLESRILELAGAELADGDQSMWRGSLVRNVVAAHTALDFQEDQSAAIRCFLDISAKRRAELAKWQQQLTGKKNAKPPPISYLNMFPARVQLATYISLANCHNTDPKLFDQLLQEYEKPEMHFKKVSQAEQDYDIASILLRYPTYPKDMAALKLLRRFAAGDVKALPDRITTPKGQDYFKRFLQRTIDVLLWNDNTTDANWVKRKFNVLLDPSTGNFATPTRVERPDDKAESTKRKNRATKTSTEPIPFPTFI